MSAKLTNKPYNENGLSNYVTPEELELYAKLSDLSKYALLASPSFSGTPKAPTPSSATNNTQIATTAFVKAVLSSSGNGLATISKNTNGYCKFTNGLIIQWGTAANVSNGSLVTLPMAFSNTNYKIVPCPTGRTATSAVVGAYNVVTYALSTTNFRIGASNPMAAMDWIAIGY